MMFSKTNQQLGRSVQLTLIRSKSAIPKGNPNITAPSDVSLSGRRVMRKIRLGKARPAVFYQFDTLVELSDGSVIKRSSQAPKDEIRMINDQRTSALWNPHRDDLRSSDLLSEAGKIGKFRSKYGGSFEEQEVKEEGKSAEETGKELTPEEEEKLRQLEQEKTKKKNDELFAMMGENAEEIKGGQLYDKKSDKKRFK